MNIASILFLSQHGSKETSPFPRRNFMEHIPLLLLFLPKQGWTSGDSLFAGSFSLWSVRARQTTTPVWLRCQCAGSRPTNETPLCCSPRSDLGLKVGAGHTVAADLSEWKMHTCISNKVNQKTLLGMMESTPNMNFTGVLKSALNWFPTQEGRWVINGHCQTLKIWPQSHRIPAFHVEG